MSEEKIQIVDIEEEMKSAYIDYSMSVIVSRALPDVRDGLKPVHRRVLFGMRELGVTATKPHKKSARIVGEVLGKYHPHGDSSVYFAMVRMAQEWSLRYPLVDGQGNFGSVDGDSPAAMRYTEARLHKIAEDMLMDLDKNTVDFKLNFDDTLEEPTVLPTKIPNLLINGASGIAVGMATNIPPHNLTEVVNAIFAVLQDPDIDIDGIMKYLKAPDFPTGGTIFGYQGVKDAYHTGRGRVVVRAKTNIEVENGRERIVVTEIPYMVNKAELIQKVADMVNEKKLEGISNANDESDRTGMRIVFDIKRDAIANIVLNKLFKYTQLQSSFSINNIALVKGRPRLLNIKQMLETFIEHRHEVILRRTQYELEQAEKKAHILEGLIIAIDHLDEVISLIRASKTPDEARTGLMEKFALSELQARAILDMRLQKLTGLERDKLKQDFEDIMKLIQELKAILADKELRKQIIKDELTEIKDKYGDERRTLIEYSSEEFNPEDFYADENVAITISNLGYIKRTALTEFKTQHRGGTGAKGGATRDADHLEHMYVASMHNTILFFTEKGKCFWLKVYEIPEGNKISKGRAIQNLLNLEADDKVKAFVNVTTITDEDYINTHNIILCTKKGIVKKTSLKEYSRPRQNGINAITIREDDTLLQARLSNGSDEIVIAARSGKAIRFNETTVRPMGRTATGVRGINIGATDEVVGMVVIQEQDETILVVSEHGYGKRSLLDAYRITNRGGKGVKTLSITDKTGKLVAIKNVKDDNDIMIINRSGLTIRLAVQNIRISGRATQGVRLINLKGKDVIASVAKVEISGLIEPDSELIEDNGLISDITVDGDFTETDE